MRIGHRKTCRLQRSNAEERFGWHPNDRGGKTEWPKKGVCVELERDNFGFGIPKRRAYEVSESLQGK